MNKIVGRISPQTVLQLAHEAFKRTVKYDGVIVNYLDENLKFHIEKKYGSGSDGRS
jgi:AICAR transformylase/IMP cyclohydrolase PurH